MELAFVDPADRRLERSLRRDVARIVRPWGLLACCALAYAGYTAVDTLPGLLHARSHAPPPVAASAESAPPASHVVSKCLEDGETSYSDAGCAPGAYEERIPLLGVPRPQASDASRLQVCRELELQVRGIALKASAAPTPADHAWLEARHQEARQEQSRLGC